MKDKLEEAEPQLVAETILEQSYTRSSSALSLQERSEDTDPGLPEVEDARERLARLS